MIGIIDYGIGNLRSVEKAVAHVGGSPIFLKTPEDFDRVQGVILPGVGAFGDCCKALRASGMWERAVAWAQSGKPFFGICVGYQMLFEGSQETPGVAGLGLLRGQVIKFPTGTLKVPQIGWNQITKGADSVYLKGVQNGEYAYFVHSFYAVPEDASLVTLSAEYGVTFPCAVGRGLLFGTQFHPEKSQTLGLKLLKNFVETCV
jgi:glutamine amidotransferase